jgi:uncharacterized membrane protein YoaK (UPF0700 family)
MDLYALPLSIMNSLLCNFSPPFIVFQAVQFIMSDWLLSTRTAVWQDEQVEGAVTNSTCSQSELLAFQQDLNSLRKVSQKLKAALRRVSMILIFLLSEVFTCEPSFWTIPV